ncbi:MAG: hypothetical protein E6Q78_05230 [Rhodoferax sp.]|nr:MAG: hypothetical protein E6Q78_05230 [Rhodoferax sp.]
MFKGDVIRKERKPSQPASTSTVDQNVAQQEPDPQRIPPSLRHWGHKDRDQTNTAPLEKLRAGTSFGGGQADHLRSTFKGF